MTAQDPKKEHDWLSGALVILLAVLVLLLVAVLMDQSNGTRILSPIYSTSWGEGLAPAPKPVYYEPEPYYSSNDWGWWPVAVGAMVFAGVAIATKGKVFILLGHALVGLFQLGASGLLAGIGAGIIYVLSTWLNHTAPENAYQIPATLFAALAFVIMLGVCMAGFRRGGK